MSSQEVDYDALVATTSVEEITEDKCNWFVLRLLKNDNLRDLWLRTSDLADDPGDYVIGGSTELGWLGHFAKKSTELEEFGINGNSIFDSCSGQSVDRFFEDLGMCNHIKKMNFDGTNLDEIINNLGPAIKSNNITHWCSTGCYLGAPGVNHLFDTFRDMNSLEELCFDDGGTNDGVMAGCIPSLATHSAMRKLTLKDQNMSTNSCAALSNIVPRMAGLQQLYLDGNSINDDCVEDLVRGLVHCKHLEALSLDRNRIDDDGFDVLIGGLPASVDRLDLGWNEITLARQLPLLRFKSLYLHGNAIIYGGARVIATSLANPECLLESLNLNRNGFGDEGAAILATSLRSNKRLTTIYLCGCNITETGWSVFSSILCDTTSIDATYNSNHTLQSLGDASRIPHDGFYDNTPQDIKMLLELNYDEDKCRVAAAKILQAHCHLDMRPLLSRELNLLPYVVAWLERFADSRLDLKLSLIYEFVRAMPMKVANRVVDKTKGEKRKLDN